MRKLVLTVECLLLGAGLAGIIPGTTQAQANKLVVIVEENEPYSASSAAARLRT